MPDRGGLRALHRLCDSVTGANWRLTRFEDELTVNQYACRVCHVIPSTTVVLPCSHILCEQCLTGCVVQNGGSICPLDAQPFCEDECQKLKLPAKTKHNLKMALVGDVRSAEPAAQRLTHLRLLRWLRLTGSRRRDGTQAFSHVTS
ncbi:hypothetical protein HPB52_014488 [Rhipicephalus sanguineus]|uniref:RING-type domain-containing protein n=1 Tax=Rhipicephalus sanguineus TaxID=34632 RepID=A0A9D4QDP3_RHISA|nr:hypothetical protein HPB52_014488 [Rhipicephalus sanguineus]